MHQRKKILKAINRQLLCRCLPDGGKKIIITKTVIQARLQKKKIYETSLAMGKTDIVDTLSHLISSKRKMKTKAIPHKLLCSQMIKKKKKSVKLPTRTILMIKQTCVIF